MSQNTAKSSQETDQFNIKENKLNAEAFIRLIKCTLILILGALISFDTGASLCIIVNWVLDFSQGLLHSNRQKFYTQEVFHLVWMSNLTNHWLMPLQLGNDLNQHWYFFEYNEFKPVFLFWPWTIESPTEQLKVIKNEDWFHSQKTNSTSITSLSWKRTSIQ